ncbi:IncQ plasmid conjugative transfer DNA nicking endonuclease TraR [Candidatus Burkholderia verschuerenii]|uniref:IncQ plasmid conjugative transfer DNA nicking endonuclease TraR n=1 Tax=Candidatus Burkholderia verschuerenii TaxID=242163 RepID=A0A0L0MHT9_9BURK|nr:relaxase/mobilization nuclease domain-containing protein [Candidatus Burkholderia verschuerenii]KND61529.1 IncQ plasmid conjugative transfer DNA nicking endonuclease TraR [Candidatus Burkholderia verschuerenii]
MTTREDHVWRLPSTVRGRDVKLKAGDAGTRPLSASAKARLARIASKAPEAMVKVTGRSRGGADHLKSHLDYITRNGKLQAETQDGERITDRARLRDLHDDWLLANAAEQRGRPSPNATQSVAIILSMPPGTPPDRVEDAARTWARETLRGRYDYIFARHDDTKHPHVHVTVLAVGYDGKRLAPGPDDLQAWRERFARELRRLGVEAKATPRQARGVVRKAPKWPIAGIERRGVEPRVRRQERQAAEREAKAPKPPQPRDWSSDIQARQDSIRRAYLGHADELAHGDMADRRLAPRYLPVRGGHASASDAPASARGRVAPCHRTAAGQGCHLPPASGDQEPQREGPTPRRSTEPANDAQVARIATRERSMTDLEQVDSAVVLMRQALRLLDTDRTPLPPRVALQG